MLFEAFPYGLHPKDLDLVVDALQKGKVAIAPLTRFMHSAACPIRNQGLNRSVH